MRGVAKVGHDAVVVWSPTFETHVQDLATQLHRGCRERTRGSFQQTPTGTYFSWLDAPKGRRARRGEQIPLHWRSVMPAVR